MAGGPLVAAAAQTTSTTTGTGALTIVNTVPAGAPAGSTTFAAAFAPTGVFPVSNIFYVIQDAQSPSNYEAGYGTLTSATNLTRDFVIFSGTVNTAVPPVPQFVQNPTASFLALAAGTANVYSNPNLLSQFTSQQARFPNFTGNAAAGIDGGLTEDIMSGSFAGTLTDGTGTTAITVKYKVSSNGVAVLQIPAASVTAAGTSMSITGVPSFLCNATVANAPCAVLGSSTGAISVPGLAAVTPGATPQATGSIVFQQYSVVATGYTAAFTTAVAKGFGFPVDITYGLI
jgi:hypothetical protein